MNTSLKELLVQQKARLEELSSKADDTGRMVANDVWDSIERQVEETTQEGFIWDSAEFAKMGVVSTAGNSFDDACEKWIIGRLSAMSDAMKEVAGESWRYDTTHSSMDNLRKSIRISKHIEPVIDEIFAKAKPSLLGLLGRVIKDELNDTLDHMDEEMTQDALRLRRAFLQCPRA